MSLLLASSQLSDSPHARIVRRYLAILLGILAMWLGCEIAALLKLPQCISPSFIIREGGGGFNRPVWFAFFLYLIYAGPPFWYVVVATVTGAALTLLGSEFLRPPLLAQSLTWGSSAALGFGLSGFVGLVLLWLRNPADRDRYLALLLPGCTFCVMITLVVFCHYPLTYGLSATDDAKLYAADETLGAQLSFVMGQVFRAMPLLTHISAFFYEAIGLPALLLVALQARPDSTFRADVVIPLIVSGVVAGVIYCFIPAVGPVYIFPQAYPYEPPPPAEVHQDALVIPDVPRNCMPSIHLSYGLIYWWLSRPYGWPLRVLMGLFLLFTALATLGFGLHYAVDLVVAFPFTVMILALTLPSEPAVRTQRWLTVAGGTVLVALWLLVLLYGLELLRFSPVLTIGAALLTVVVSYLAEMDLARKWEAAAAQNRLAAE